MRRFATALLFTMLLAAAPAAAAECRSTGDYPEALCRYRVGHLERAETLFAEIAERGEFAPETIKAEYFLARTRMRMKRWDDAAKGLMKIYLLDPSFYREWGCDFLLGECRRAVGRE